jgi:predicted RNase H-related nuclease YkuK (DUF458 family)
MNRQLARKVTGVEIKEAVFSIHLDKAPANDGTTKKIFQSKK